MSGDGGDEVRATGGQVDGRWQLSHIHRIISKKWSLNSQFLWQFFFTFEENYETYAVSGIFHWFSCLHTDLWFNNILACTALYFFIFHVSICNLNVPVLCSTRSIETIYMSDV